MYQAAYNRLSTTVILNQVIAIIQRDQAAAIAAVNPDLAAILEFHKGPGMRTAFPWLMLGGSRVYDRDAQTHTRHPAVRVVLDLEIGQFDFELAADLSCDYEDVLDMILSTATTVDWETALPIEHRTVPGGFTTPFPSGTIKEVFIASSSDVTRATSPDEPTPIFAVLLELLFELEMGRNMAAPY